jgi:hypothetical protein
MTYPSGASTPCGSITNINGWYSPSDKVKVEYSGITRPYQDIKIFFGIISRGSWDGTEQIDITFSNMGDLKSRNIFARDFGLSGKCSPDSTDYIYRIRGDYIYTTQNTPLSWDIQISGINGNTNG